jgi:hypothetical protein
MRHNHTAPLDRLCPGCYDEIAEDEKTRRFWIGILVGFSLALAGVIAFVLFKLGPMGR